jgi:hypothetical protein
MGLDMSHTTVRALRSAPRQCVVKCARKHLAELICESVGVNVLSHRTGNNGG